MLSFIKQQNPEAAINKLLKSLSISIAPEKISAELEKHPDYPSLLAISDILSWFGIENAAYRVDRANLPTVPCPFIAHTHINNGDFLVVHKLDENEVVVSSDTWNKHKLSLQEFKKLFKGVVLTAESSSDFAPDRSFMALLSSIKTPLMATAILLVLFAALFQSGFFAGITWQAGVLSVFKTAGLITSLLLLVQSIDSNNPLVLKLCQGDTKNNCNAILSSKAAKVFDGLSWSEVGFFYFGGTWLLLLFGGNQPAIWMALTVLNIVSLPYTFYSIYYQARVAKQWCVMCCTVQALLWLEFISVITNARESFAATGINWVNAGITIFICLLIPVVLWQLLKPLFLKVQQLQPLKSQLHKFKYNTELFTNTVTAQAKYTQPDDEWCIVLGNVEANNIITMVSNPYCPPCSKMHKALDELLDNNGNIQARIVFTANNTDDDIKTPVTRHLMALNEGADKALVKKALHDWYEQKQKSYEAWAKVYPVQLNEANFYKLERQHEWCKLAEVSATPTMLLNGYRLPELYQIADLKYMLD
ncbi:MAG TPA: cysteine peptidase family C39 domain-containing protein [Mucilaginibacter sp.]